MPLSDAPAMALQILNETADGVLITDQSRSGNPIVYANAAFKRITGYPAAETIGRSCRFLQGADQDQPEIATMREALAASRPVVVTLRNYRRDGAMFWNEVRLAPLQEPGTADIPPRYYVGFQRDVTDRVEAQHKLWQSRRAAEEATLAKLEFFKAMGHELRTPIGIITGFSELLIAAAQQGPRHAQQLSQLQDINGAGHHLLMLVDDAARYLAVQSPADLRRSRAHLSRVVEGAVQRMKLVLHEHGAELHVAVAGSMEIDGDLPLLEHAIANLIAEVSRRASLADKVTIELRDEGEQAAIDVRCSSVVLPAEVFRNLGRQVHGERLLYRGLEGFGVTLTVAERIIRFHGGQLRVQSREGIGTIMGVTLPRAVAQLTASQSAVGTNAAS